MPAATELKVRVSADIADTIAAFEKLTATLNECNAALLKLRRALPWYQRVRIALCMAYERLTEFVKRNGDLGDDGLPGHPTQEDLNNYYRPAHRHYYRVGVDRAKDV